MAWKTSDGKKEASRFSPQLAVLLKGMLNPTTLLDLVRNFIVFEEIGCLSSVLRCKPRC
jgi:type I restriction enzyme R subunit